MVTLTIDSRQVTVPEGTTIMEAAQKLGIQIPHLCYLKDINRIAACRVCCVEVEGERAMVTACNSFVKEGIVVHTNSPRARRTRRTNVELILSQHDCKCATCVRSGNCQLQTLANDLGILTVPYETQLPRGLRERDDTGRAFAALADRSKITVVQVAPAVRTAWGEYFGLSREEATMERMAACLRRMGFDYIFDTNFTADLTIMEEGNEFLHRLKSGDLAQWPMFTSCCPGWVRFLKGQYPELVGQLSSAKSPQQMFGSVTKSWFAQKLGVEPEKLFCVSVMPCVAKKAECELPTMATEHGPNVDLVLTTRELVRMLRADQLDPASIPEEPLDSPLDTHTGAGVIFGATGGVMEAALRTASYVLTGENPDPDAFAGVRTGPGLREATYEIAGIPVRCAVVSGLDNARQLIERLKAGKVHYDFVEVMACPGGCVGGGGQPISVEDEERYGVRGERLYELDRANPMRFSHENPDVQTLYSEFLGQPLSEKAEELLHTDHMAWKMPNQTL